MTHLPTGLYLPGDSLIHRLDSRIKLLVLFITIVAILLVGSLIGYGIMVVFIAMTILLSRISLSTAINSVSNLTWFFLVIFLMNTAFYSPENAWLTIWIFTPSLMGVMQGVDVVLRVCLVLVISNVITSATAPMEITNALEYIILPLKYIGIPAEQIAMILSIAIQFIPTLSEETDMIRKAQMARGARFDSPKLTEKARAVLPLLIPIFFSAFKRADELSIAMEARGYRSAADRTHKTFKPLQVRDYGALAMVIVVGILQIMIR
jgi:energy-coupling factor transport system permease protein